MDSLRNERRLKYYAAVVAGTVILAIALVLARSGQALAQADEECPGVRLCASSSAIPITARDPVPVQVEGDVAVVTGADSPLAFKFFLPRVESLFFQEINLTLASGQQSITHTLSLQTTPVQLQPTGGWATAPPYQLPRVKICPTPTSCVYASSQLTMAAPNQLWQWHIVPPNFLPLYPGAQVRLERGGSNLFGPIQLSLPLLGS